MEENKFEVGEMEVIKKPKKKVNKAKCLIIKKFEYSMYILLNNMVYSIDNSKIKEANDKFVFVEYEEDKGNIKFV